MSMTYQPLSMVDINFPVWFDIGALLVIVVTMGTLVRYPTVYGFYLVRSLFERMLGNKQPTMRTHTTHAQRQVGSTTPPNGGLGGNNGGLGGGGLTPSGRL